MSPKREFTTVVTGGAGRIGSRLVEWLQATRPVLSLDKVLTENCPSKKVDISDFAALEESIPPGSDVVHLAGLDFDMNCTDSEFLTANVVGTWNVLKAAESKAARRVIICSSLAATGLHIRDEKPPVKLPVDENFVPQVKDAYGASKLAAEAIASSFSAKGTIEVTVLRPGAVLFPESVAVFNDDIQSRPGYLDYIAIGDLVRAIELALDSAAPFSDPAFIVADDIASLSASLDWFSTTFGSIPKTLEHSYFTDFPRASIFDNRLAKSRLSWEPTTDFSEFIPEPSDIKSHRP